MVDGVVAVLEDVVLLLALLGEFWAEVDRRVGAIGCGIS